MTLERENPLNDLRKANEEHFFRKKERELANKFKSRLEMKDIGLQNETLEGDLLQAGFNKDSARALFIVPLVDVAWADNEIHPEEREEILNIVDKRGIEKNSEALKLVSLWLKEPPKDEMFLKAKSLLGPMIDELKKSSQDSATWILRGVKTVAEASGGVLSRIGIGGRISTAEEEIIKRIGERINSKNKK